jgi:hypothetical protein
MKTESIYELVSRAYSVMLNGFEVVTMMVMKSSMWFHVVTVTTVS